MLRWGGCLAFLLVVAPAAAQDGGVEAPEGEPEALPTRVIARPVTLPAGVVALTPGALIGRRTERFDWSVGGTVRVAAGLHDRWELAVEPIPFQLEAWGERGVFTGRGRGPQLWSPRFDTTVHFFETPGTVDFALRGGAVLPLPDDRRGLRFIDLQHRAIGSYYVHLGAFVRIPLGILRLDLGGRLALINSNDGDVVNELRVDALVQPIPELAFGLRVAQGTLFGDSSAVPVFDPRDPSFPTDLILPVEWYVTVGASVVATVRPGLDAPPIDLGLDAFFPRFLYQVREPVFILPGGDIVPGAVPSRRDRLDVVQILATVRVHLDLAGRLGTHPPPRTPPAPNEPPERWVVPAEQR